MPYVSTPMPPLELADYAQRENHSAAKPRTSTKAPPNPRQPAVTAAVSIEELPLVAQDGVQLSATLFTPSVSAYGTLIIHSATATPQGYYRRFAERAARVLGARVLTYDYRGIGRSRPASLHGFQATLTDWARLDAAAAHAFVRERFAGEPFAIIGHSFGGQLVGLLDEPRAAVAAVMVGAQLAYYRDWPAREQRKLGLVWGAVVPAATKLFGYMPGRLGLAEDLPRGVAEQWARWCLHPDYLISEHLDARERFARFDAPTLFYSFTDDAYAPKDAVSALLRRLPRAPLTHVRIDPKRHALEPIGHFGFFKPRFASTLWVETFAYLRTAFAGQPPHHVPVVPRALALLSLHDEVMTDLQYGRG